MRLKIYPSDVNGCGVLRGDSGGADGITASSLAGHVFPNSVNSGMRILEQTVFGGSE